MIRFDLTFFTAGFYLAEVIAANRSKFKAISYMRLIVKYQLTWCCRLDLFDGKVVLELGAGVGITGKISI